MEGISDIISKATSYESDEKGVVSKVIQTKLQQILGEMLDTCDQITGAMVSSIDGLAWAEKLQDGLDSNRFAAMSSAMLALSDTMMKETQSTTPKNVLLQGNSGMIFILHAGSNLLLTVFTVDTPNIGMPLTFAKKATEKISSLNLNE